MRTTEKVPWRPFFFPHSFHTRAQTLGNDPVWGQMRLQFPRILITEEALEKMQVIVDLALTEIGWFGKVKKLENGDFLIEDVYLIRQNVCGSQTNLLASGQAEFVIEMLAKGKEGEEIVDHCFFWGHSHVNMPTSPSGRDEDQMWEFKLTGVPWYIRGIFNKLGRAEFTIFDFERDLKIVDAEWSVTRELNPAIRAQIENEFKAKVTQVAMPTSSYPTFWDAPYRKPRPVYAGSRWQDRPPYEREDWEDGPPKAAALPYDGNAETPLHIRNRTPRRKVRPEERLPFIGAFSWVWERFQSWWMRRRNRRERLARRRKALNDRFLVQPSPDRRNGRFDHLDTAAPPDMDADVPIVEQTGVRLQPEGRAHDGNQSDSPHGRV